MKFNNRNPESNCESVESLIIKRMYDPLSREEDEILQTHLQNCSHCQQFEQQLDMLFHSLRIQEKIRLPAEEKMIRLIHNRIKTYSSGEKRFKRERRNRIRNILTYPIPLYQALLGAFLLLMILIGVILFPTPNQQNSLSPALSGKDKESHEYQLQVLDNLNILNQQRIGITVEEDTLLTNFMVSMM